MTLGKLNNFLVQMYMCVLQSLIEQDSNLVCQMNLCRESLCLSDKEN